MGIIDRLKDLEARGDAWAAKRLSAEEFCEARELDRYLKAKAVPLSLGYIAATLVLGGLLLGIKPAIPFGEALVLANVLLFSLGIALMGVWFGHRRHQGKPLWRTVLVLTLLTTVGAVCGALVARLTSGRAILEVQPAELVRFLSVGILTGLVVSAFVVGVAWIRNREARAREAALRAEAERERFAKRTTEAELKLLQAQVEPHFLFNTLANLRYLVQTGSPDALAMLDHLIDYLRTALPEMRAESSTVGREAALARSYLEILRIRMGGELLFSIHIEPGLEPHAFPPLILMTLVENAVKHGVAPAGRGRIDVRVLRSAGRLRVEVDDDGRGIASAPGNGVGLVNVRERLAALYGASGTLALGPGTSGGARAVVEIPEAA